MTAARRAFIVATAALVAFCGTVPSMAAKKAAKSAQATPAAASAPASAASAGTSAQACPPPLAQPSPEAVQTLVRNARDHGFLWRLTKDGHTSYLFGTLHVGKFDWVFPGPQLRNAITSTDELALELDMSDAATLAQIQKTLADTPPVKLPAELQARLDQQVRQSCGGNSEELAHLPVAMQAVTLSLLDGRREGLEPALAQEVALGGMAHAQKRKVVALETVKMQLDVLLPSDPAVVTAMVADTVGELERNAVRAPLARLSNDWAAGNLDDLANYAAWCGCASTPEELAELRGLNDDRNPQIADHIAAIHAEGTSVLAAVGSLHMTGPNALPKLLAAKGFTVERVTFAQAPPP